MFICNIAQFYEKTVKFISIWNISYNHSSGLQLEEDETLEHHIFMCNLSIKQD